MARFFAFVVFSLFAVTAFATLGVDLSTGVTAELMNCLRKEGYNYAIPRVYTELGDVDTAGVATLIHAKKAGFGRADGYIFPCFACKKTATEQVNELVAYLKSYPANVSALWIDIEGTQWSKEHGVNAKFVDQMAKAIRNHGIPFGYYLSESSYDEILSPWKNQFNEALLWYAHWDNVKSFSDWRPYGGFTKPHMKQFTGGITICGRKDFVDQNYKP